MSDQSKQVACGRMLIVADHPDELVQRFAEACRSRGWIVEEAEDVYIAMSRLASAGVDAFVRVIVDTRTLDDAETAFLDSAPRYFAGLQVSELAEFVQGNGSARRLLDAAGGSDRQALTPTEIASASRGQTGSRLVARHTERISLRNTKYVASAGPPPDRGQPPHEDAPIASGPAAQVADDGIPVGLDPVFGDQVEHPLIVGRIGPAMESSSSGSRSAASPPETGAGGGSAREPSLHEVVRMRMDASFGSRRVQRVPPGSAGSSASDQGMPPVHPQTDELGAVLSKEELDALLNPDGADDGGRR